MVCLGVDEGEWENSKRNQAVSRRNKSFINLTILQPSETGLNNDVWSSFLKDPCADMGYPMWSKS